MASVLIVGHFLLVLAFSLSVPLAEAPDEADHWAYIVYLAQERSLPVGPTVTQSKHPPLYHATAALISYPAGPSRTFLRPNPDVSFHPEPNGAPNFFVHSEQESWPWRDGVLAFRLARLWSMVINTATVAAIYGLASTIFPRERWLVLATVGALAFWPQFAFIGGAVNNDNAAAFFGTLALWGAFSIYRGKGELRRGWWTPLALGLGLLCKVSTVGVWPAVGIAILLGTVLGCTENTPHGSGGQERRTGARPQRELLAGLSQWRLWLGPSIARGVLVFGIAVLIASPWLGRNWLLYGDPLGLEMARQTVDLRTAPWTWAETAWLLRGWFLSFWGKFGAIGHVAMADWVYALLGLISLVSILGLVKALITAIPSSSSTPSRGLPGGVRRRNGASSILLGLLALTTFTVAGLMWRYSLLALGTDQGRLLYPAVAAIVILFVYGLSVPIPKKHERIFCYGLTCSMLALSIYALFGVVRPAFGPPPTLSLTEVAAQLENGATNQLDAPIEFRELHLIGWTLEPEPVLYWQSPTQPTVDWRTRLRITAEDGTLMWEWSRSPGGGRWSTDHWPPGTIVADGYAVRWPAEAGSGRFRVEVGVHPFSEDLVRPLQIGVPISTDEHRFAQLGWLVREEENLTAPQ